jgi:AGZA family xanthine/uracil permease-like MFS transporter
VRRDIAAPAQSQAESSLSRWFELSKRGSTWGREVRGGVVTFVTMAYIVVLGPLILGTATDGTGSLIGGFSDVGGSIGAVAAVMALVAGVMSIIMGAIGRLPLAIAAGLGLLPVVAFSLAPRMTWADAMGLIILEGLLVLVLVLVGLRKKVFDAIPDPLKFAIGVGIGLFITLIGLVDAGITRPGNPLISFGVNGNLSGWSAFIFVFGLLLMSVLVVLKVRGGLLIGILITTVLAIILEVVFGVGGRSEGNPGGWGLNVPSLPESLVASPDLSLIGQFNLFGAFTAIGILAAGLAVFSLMLTDFFDTMGTAFGISAEGDLLTEDNDVPNMQAVLAVDAAAAVVGGAASASSNTAYIESAAGVGDGARTGIAAMVTGALFLVAMFFTPLVSVVPWEAAAPALVVVGAMMMMQVRKIDFMDLSIGIPAFLTIVLMPFTYSIVNGIGAGFVSWVVIKVFQGRAREIPAVMWVVTVAFAVYFASEPISGWIG